VKNENVARSAIFILKFQKGLNFGIAGRIIDLPMYRFNSILKKHKSYFQVSNYDDFELNSEFYS
jgi:predicted HTH domain antitoxin